MRRLRYLSGTEGVRTASHTMRTSSLSTRRKSGSRSMKTSSLSIVTALLACPEGRLSTNGTLTRKPTTITARPWSAPIWARPTMVQPRIGPLSMFLQEQTVFAWKVLAADARKSHGSATMVSDVLSSTRKTMSTQVTGVRQHQHRRHYLHRRISLLQTCGRKSPRTWSSRKRSIPWATITKRRTFSSTSWTTCAMRMFSNLWRYPTTYAGNAGSASARSSSNARGSRLRLLRSLRKSTTTTNAKSFTNAMIAAVATGRRTDQCLQSCDLCTPILVRRRCHQEPPRLQLLSHRAGLLQTPNLPVLTAPPGMLCYSSQSPCNSTVRLDLLCVPRRGDLPSCLTGIAV